MTAPTFHGTAWEVEAAELLWQLAPTPACDAAVAKIARMVRQAVWPIFPGAEVAGYANGSLTGGKAFGVAVPDIDIVVTVSAAQLARRAQKKELVPQVSTDPIQVQKCAIRACIERLVGTGLKFRRSAFRGREPKVTFIVPASVGISDETIPIDFSINSLTPLHNARLLEACAKMEPRTRGLTLLVKRWAKDRGICHAAKGHFPPYAWTLLSIFYLQAGEEGHAFLPPLDDVLSGAPSKVVGAAGRGTPVGDLFKGFLRFYARDYDWQREIASVRLGRRERRACDDAPGPRVEDPFDTACDFGAVMTAESLTRLHEELARARGLCSGETSLATLLQPWAPPVALAEGDEQPSLD